MQCRQVVSPSQTPSIIARLCGPLTLYHTHSHDNHALQLHRSTPHMKPVNQHHKVRSQDQTTLITSHARHDVGQVDMHVHLPQPRQQTQQPRHNSADVHSPRERQGKLLFKVHLSTTHCQARLAAATATVADGLPDTVVSAEVLEHAATRSVLHVHRQMSLPNPNPTNPNSQCQHRAEPYRCSFLWDFFTHTFTSLSQRDPETDSEPIGKVHTAPQSLQCSHRVDGVSVEGATIHVCESCQQPAHFPGHPSSCGLHMLSQSEQLSVTVSDILTHTCRSL